MHLLLRKAMYLDGEIIPVPRNASYGETPTISSAYLEAFITAQTVDIPTDEELAAEKEKEELENNTSTTEEGAVPEVSTIE